MTAAGIKEVWEILSIAGWLCAQIKVQFSSVTQLCPTLCNPMNCSTPGLPVHHQLPEFTPKVRGVLFLTKGRGAWTLGNSDNLSHTHTFLRTKLQQSNFDSIGPCLLNDGLLLQISNSCCLVAKSYLTLLRPHGL